MVRWVIPAALLVLVSGSQLEARPLSNAPTPVTVVLCDRAGIAGAEKVKALEQADRILQSVDVQLRWVETETCVGPGLESYFSIVIVPERPSDLPASPKAMGRAVLVGTAYPRAY